MNEPEIISALRAAQVARQALLRNKVLLTSAMKSSGYDWTWLDGVIRNLEHSKTALSNYERCTTTASGTI